MARGIFGFIYMGLMVLGLQFDQALLAQDFYVKNSSGEFERSPWPLKFDFERFTKKRLDPKTNTETEVPYYKLRLQDRALLKQLAEDESKIPFTPIYPRELSTLEKGIDVAILVFSSLMMLLTHDVYDLGPEFRLTRIHGFAFIVLRVDSSYLYYRCGNKERLVAVTDEPTESVRERLKSFDEVRELCELNLPQS